MKLRRCVVDLDAIDPLLTALDQISTDHECLIQAVDARYLAGRVHAQTAVRHARRAIDHDDTIATDPNLEVLLYVAATRQIDDAFICGISPDTSQAVIVIDGGDETAAAAAVTDLQALAVDPGIELGDPAVLADWFEITDRERAATAASLEQLVCERVALLAVDH